LGHQQASIFYNEHVGFEKSAKFEWHVNFSFVEEAQKPENVEQIFWKRSSFYRSTLNRALSFVFVYLVLILFFFR